MAVADVVIKQEAVDVVDLEERVVQLCKENPKGITDQIISQDMPNIPPQQRVTAINRLLSMVGISLNLGWWSPNGQTMGCISPVLSFFLLSIIAFNVRCPLRSELYFVFR